METFDAFQNPDGDVQLQLESWLKACTGKFEMDQPNWLNVLRCVNQGIVFPAVFHMKKMFTEKFAYKDLKGSWKVRISILGRDLVEIQHRKGEKSQLTGAQDNFTFTWSIIFRLDLAGPELEASVSIVDYILDKDMDKSTRGELLAAMQPFLSDSAPYLAIWRKPLRKLPVSRDFGRLCARLSVFNHLGRPIHTRSAEDTATSLIKKVMLTLAECFNPELVPGLEESFALRFREEGEPMEQLTKVLHEDKVVPEDSHLAAVLKCINTTIVFPAVDFLHSRIYEKMRYKDVRGTWATHITLGPAMRSGSAATGLNMSSSHLSSGGFSSSPSNPSVLQAAVNRGDDYIFSGSPVSEASQADSADQTGEVPRYRYVSILHRKMEQAYSPEPKDQFQFEWIVEFVLSREMTIKEVHMGVVDFSFGPQTSDETKSHVLSCLKPFLRPSSFQTQAAAVPTHDLIDIAIKKLEEAEGLAKTLLSAYHPNMPHSIDLRSLLLALRSSVPNIEVRLPSADSRTGPADKSQPSTSPSSPGRGNGPIRHSVSTGALIGGSGGSHSVHYAQAGSRLSASIESPPGSMELPPRVSGDRSVSSRSTDLETLAEMSPPNSRKSSPMARPARDGMKSPRSSTSSNSSSSTARHQSERLGRHSPRSGENGGTKSPRSNEKGNGDGTLSPRSTSSPKSPRSKKKEISSTGASGTSPTSTRSSSPLRKSSKGSRTSAGASDLPSHLSLPTSTFSNASDVASAISASAGEGAGEGGVGGGVGAGTTISSSATATTAGASISTTSAASSVSPRHMASLLPSGDSLPASASSLGDTPLFHLNLPSSAHSSSSGPPSPPSDTPPPPDSPSFEEIIPGGPPSRAPGASHMAGGARGVGTGIPLVLPSPRFRPASSLDPPSHPDSPVTPKPLSSGASGKIISKTLRTPVSQSQQAQQKPQGLPSHIAASLPSQVPPPLSAPESLYDPSDEED